MCSTNGQNKMLAASKVEVKVMFVTFIAFMRGVEMFFPHFEMK